MESAKIDEAERLPNETKVIETGAVSEETKGKHIPVFESPMFPSTLG